jgi:hypothetical protein
MDGIILEDKSTVLRLHGDMDAFPMGETCKSLSALIDLALLRRTLENNDIFQFPHRLHASALGAWLKCFKLTAEFSDGM